MGVCEERVEAGEDVQGVQDLKDSSFIDSSLFARSFLKSKECFFFIIYSSI